MLEVEIQTHPALTERELTLSFQAGNLDAFDQVYQAHHVTVSRLCSRMLRTQEDAEEATQETFIRVYEGLARFNGRYLLRAWICRIATNVCLDALRASRRRPPLSPLEEGSHLPDLTEAAPEEALMRSFDGKRVRTTLNNLPPLHRAAIVLRDVEGFSYDEIATALSISPTQVKALIHRARQGFKKSWIRSALHVLVPTRLIGRLRLSPKISTEATRAGELAANSSTYVANCSAFLQQCGQFASERAAAIITAAVVGGTAIAAPAAGVPAPSSSTSIEAVKQINDVVIGKRVVNHEAPKHEAEQPAPKDVSEPSTPIVPAAEPTPAEQEPAPEPDPTPTAEPAPPEPTGFSMDFSADVGPASPCACTFAAPFEEMSILELNEYGMTSFQERFSGTAKVDGSALPLVLTQKGSLESHDLSFTLSTTEGMYSYSGAGAFEGMSNEAWGGWTYRYVGTYRVTGRPTSSEKIPVTGRYSASITIAPASHRVVNTTFQLLEDA